ncbi:MAG: polysaccharide biosynthesis tyrosine autokinase, partial [Ginsengibacter sp.]
ADQMIAWINDRMASLGKELDIAQNNLRRYSAENNLMDVEQQQSAYLTNISEADKAINEQMVLLSTADFLTSYLKDKKNEYGTLPVLSNFGLEDPTLSALIGAYNLQQIKRNELLDANVSANHPFVLELNDQINKTKASIFVSIENVKRSLSRHLSELRRNTNTDMGELRDIRYRSKDYVELTRQVENKQILFNVLQAKKEETSISRASNIASTQIVESAYVSGTPIKPNRRNIQMMSILVGLLLPALIIFGGEMLNDKVSTRFDVEKITTAPILSEIGHSYSDEVLIVNKTTRSMVAEQFRIIRSNLQYVIGKAERFTLLITSSFSGEGKSFLSTNLGAVMALTGKKTVILEFDIRKPKVVSGLKMSKGPGITNYLIGKSELSEIIRQVPDTENLYIIGCGPIPPNPSELLLNDKVAEMFELLKKDFDVIIVDTAPVGMVSDAQTLSKFADSTLYMVRQGHTFKKQITLIDEYYVQNKLPKVAIVINDVKLRTGYGYYGYGRYGYGYGYGYGSYYEEEVPPPGFFERLLTYLNPLKWFSKK